MLNSRRQLLVSAGSLAALISLPSRLFSGQTRPIEYKSSPNAPNPNAPQGMNGPPPKGTDQKTVDRQNQEALRSDVDKLYALAAQMKQELSTTNTAAVLPADMVKNAKEIEKLAKQIRELAKG